MTATLIDRLRSGRTNDRGETTRQSQAVGSDRARLVSEILVVAICALWTVPTIGLLISSLRPADDVTTSGWWTVLAGPFSPGTWTTANYADVLLRDGMAQAFLNSLTVAIPATIVPVGLAAFAAYALVWMRFPGRQPIMLVLLFIFAAPVQLALIPLLQLFVQLGVNGTFFAVWIAHAGFGLPLAIYILHGYLSTLPREVLESARVDGADHLQTFMRLVVPMSVPGLAAFAIFQFLWVWNDLLVALVFLGGQSDVAVVTVRLTELVGTQGESWHLLTAGAFVTMVLPLIVFFSLQRYFVSGLTSGAVKS